MNVLLGSNVINECDAALVVNGEEVFRFRHGTNDQQLICDFDLYSPTGDRIAKVAKNQVVYAAEGYRYEATANESRVLRGDNEVVVSVERIDGDTLKVNGTFHINGHTVVVTNDSLRSAGVVMQGNIISGFNKAITIDPDSFTIGSS